MPQSSTVSRLPPQLPVREIAAAVEALIALLDQASGDPDLEPDGDDLGDQSYPEAAGPRASVINGRAAGHEDAEDDDEAEDDDPREEDDPGGGNVTDEPHDPYSEDGL